LCVGANCTTSSSPLNELEKLPVESEDSDLVHQFMRSRAIPNHSNYVWLLSETTHHPSTFMFSYCDLFDFSMTVVQLACDGHGYVMAVVDDKSVFKCEPKYFKKKSPDLKRVIYANAEQERCMRVMCEQTNRTYLHINDGCFQHTLGVKGQDKRLAGKKYCYQVRSFKDAKNYGQRHDCFVWSGYSIDSLTGDGPENNKGWRVCQALGQKEYGALEVYPYGMAVHLPTSLTLQDSDQCFLPAFLNGKPSIRVHVFKLDEGWNRGAIPMSRLSQYLPRVCGYDLQGIRVENILREAGKTVQCCVAHYSRDAALPQKECAFSLLFTQTGVSGARYIKNSMIDGTLVKSHTVIWVEEDAMTILQICNDQIEDCVCICACKERRVVKDWRFYNFIITLNGRPKVRYSVCERVLKNVYDSKISFRGGDGALQHILFSSPLSFALTTVSAEPALQLSVRYYMRDKVRDLGEYSIETLRAISELKEQEISQEEYLFSHSGRLSRKRDAGERSQLKAKRQKS